MAAPANVRNDHVSVRRRQFPVWMPGLADTRRCPVARRLGRPAAFLARMRKQRKDLGKRRLPQQPNCESSAKRLALDRPPLDALPKSAGGARQSPAAHMPACHEGDTPTSAVPVRSAAGLSSVACRIAAGRTWPRLEALTQEHLFSEVGPCRVDDCVPRPGLFAWPTEDGCYVFIITEKWTRRGVPLVDVAPLRKHREADSMIARRRSVMTKRVSVLCVFLVIFPGQRS